MARRRNRIVHEADLASSSTVIEPWSIVDTWQIVQWNLAVVPFYYQMLILLTKPHPVFVEKYNNARKAMDENIKFAKQLMHFPKTPSELQLKALSDMKDGLSSVIQLLRQPTGS
jgi:hypothetical protein